MHAGRLLRVVRSFSRAHKILLKLLQSLRQGRCDLINLVGISDSIESGLTVVLLIIGKSLQGPLSLGGRRLLASLSSVIHTLHKDGLLYYL